MKQWCSLSKYICSILVFLCFFSLLPAGVTDVCLLKKGVSNTTFTTFGLIGIQDTSTVEKQKLTIPSVQPCAATQLNIIKNLIRSNLRNKKMVVALYYFFKESEPLCSFTQDVIDIFVKYNPLLFKHVPDKQKAGDAWREDIKKTLEYIAIDESMSVKSTPGKIKGDGRMGLPLFGIPTNLVTNESCVHGCAAVLARITQDYGNEVSTVVLFVPSVLFPFLVVVLIQEFGWFNSDFSKVSLPQDKKKIYKNIRFFSAYLKQYGYRYEH